MKWSPPISRNISQNELSGNTFFSLTHIGHDLQKETALCKSCHQRRNLSLNRITSLNANTDHQQLCFEIFKKIQLLFCAKL